MRSTRTTNAVQRVDMLLVQAERFAQVTSAEEAIARARQVIAYAKRESARHPELADELRMRALLAESLIARLGERTRDASGELLVRAGDARTADAWD
jgi:hypothetical protein